MQSIGSCDFGAEVQKLYVLLQGNKITDPAARAHAERLFAQIQANQTHICPDVPGWPYAKQREFVVTHRHEPMVLWNLRSAMMASQGKEPESLERICHYRVSNDNATRIVELCSAEGFPMDSKNPDIRAFGSEFAWSVPTPEVATYIHALTAEGAREVVEIGAGLGYLAREMRAKKITWHAYDKFADTFPKERLWTEVLPGGPEKLREHANPDTILCLCFPPQIGMEGYEMDATCAAFFRGRDILYIGDELTETDENSTGSKKFATMLNKLNYKLVKVLPCAQSPHHFDKLFHYQRTK